MEIVIAGEDLKGAVEAASRVLAQGGVVAYPTETFYALGARFDDAGALSRLLDIKGRAEGKPLPLIVGSEATLSLVAEEVGGPARRLMERFWPGPLTILFRARKGLNPAIVLDGKAAVRMPGESFALLLARSLAYPITATSANPSGEPPPAEAAAVARYFPEGVDLIVDAGPAPGGRPSTIVDATGDNIKVVREGAVDVAEFL